MTNMRITDGHGSGSIAKVDSNGRLCVTLGDEDGKFDDLCKKVDDMHSTLAELMLLLLCDQKEKEHEIKDKTEE